MTDNRENLSKTPNAYVDTNQSSKTSSGISKNLLTPCRRVGLTRNRKSISPLISTQNIQSLPVEVESPLTTTPLRKIAKRNINKKTETHIFKQTESVDSKNESESPISVSKPLRNKSVTKLIAEEVEIESVDENLDKISSTKEHSTATPGDENIEEIPKSKRKSKAKKITASPKLAKKSDISLTKQCMIVIEKNILNEENIISIESDSDNETLVSIAKRTKVQIDSTNDNPSKLDPDALTKNKIIDPTDLVLLNDDCKNTEQPTKLTSSQHSLSSSQNSDDDKEFDCKKTILIKKTYSKPVLAVKSKSTGSITQKDIDDIKKRIQMKQNEILVKSKGHNIVELQNLIKKWRKGCQEALLHLLELMKQKFPDKEHMELPELLKMMNITPDLIHYDVLEDCFN